MVPLALVGLSDDSGVSWKVSKNAERDRCDVLADVNWTVKFLSHHRQDYLVRLGAGTQTLNPSWSTHRTFRRIVFTNGTATSTILREKSVVRPSSCHRIIGWQVFKFILTRW